MKTKSGILKRVFVAALFGLIVVAPVRAQMREKLPMDSILYVEFAGTEQTLEGRLTTPFGRLMNDPGMKAFNASVWEAITNVIAKEAGKSGDAEVAAATKNVIAHLWTKGFALSLGNLEMSQQGPDFSFAIVAPSGSKADGFVDGVHRMLQQPDVPPSSPVEVDGHQLMRFALPAPMPIPAHYGVVDGKFIFTIGNTAPAKIIAAMSGKSPNLAANESMNAAFKTIGIEQGYVNGVFHLDIQAALAQSKAIFEAMGQPDFPPMARMVIDGLGFGSCQSVTAASHFDNGGYKSSMFVKTDNERQGIFKLANQKPLTEDDLKWIPKNVNFAYAFNYDHLKAYDDMITVLNSIPMAGMYAQQGIQKIEQHLGLSIRNDILTVLDDNVIYFDSPNAGGSWFTGITACLEVKDPAKMQALIERATKAAIAFFEKEARKPITYRIRTSDFDEYKLNYLEVSGVPLPLAISWCFHENRMVVGLMPHTVRYAMDRATGKKAFDTSILANEDFRRGRKQFPKDVVAINYIDTNRGLSDMYRFASLGALAFGNFAPAADVDLDFARFPTHDTFVAGAFGNMSATWIDESGLHYSGHGPWPIPFGPTSHVNAAGALMSVSILLPSLSRARVLSKRLVSATQLKDIGAGCAIYAHENGGKFPPDIQTLVANGYIAESILYHPDSDRTTCSYTYIHGHSKDSHPRWVLGYEKFVGQTDEGANVLFADMHVEFVKPLARVHELVDQTRRDMAGRTTP